MKLISCNFVGFQFKLMKFIYFFNEILIIFNISALHTAIIKENIEIVKLLMSYKNLNINQTNVFYIIIV